MMEYYLGMEVMMEHYWWPLVKIYFRINTFTKALKPSWSHSGFESQTSRKIVKANY